MGILFSKRRPDGGFTPSLLHRLVTPKKSGNDINGLGGRTRRRPTPLYHHPDVTVTHHVMQNLFYARYLFKPWTWGYMRRCMKAYDPPHDPVAPARVRDTAENWTRAVKGYALERGAALVGITPMKADYVYESYDVPEHPWLVIIGVAMDQPTLSRMVDPGFDRKAAKHVLDIYTHGSHVAHDVANWIRARGWEAFGRCGPAAGQLNLIPAALEAGLGELGKHGSIINREWGSSFRLAYVLTDLPLVGDGPDRFNVDDFCTSCQICSRACPPDAIFAQKQWVRGERKWYVDFDRCIPYFNDTQGCGICVTVCPWSKPGTAPKLAAKMERRSGRAATSK